MNKQVICPDRDKCNRVCAHAKPHDVIRIWRGRKNINYCNMECTEVCGSNVKCVPLVTKWDK